MKVESRTTRRLAEELELGDGPVDEAFRAMLGVLQGVLDDSAAGWVWADRGPDEIDALVVTRGVVHHLRAVHEPGSVECTHRLATITSAARCTLSVAYSTAPTEDGYKLEGEPRSIWTFNGLGDLNGGEPLELDANCGFARRLAQEIVQAGATAPADDA